MGSVGKQYMRAIYERYLYLAAWLPNANLRIGDVGIQQGEEFKQMTTLKDLGIPFRVRKGKDPLEFTYTSGSGVKIQTKLAGELAVGTTLPLGEAGISLRFSEEAGFVFKAVGCLIDEIDNKAALGQAVVTLAKAGMWEPGWAVIDTLVHAESATIVVSNSGSASLDLTAKVPVTLANLANLDTGLSANSQTGEMIQFIAAKGLTPMFGLSRVKQSLLSKFLGNSSGITFGGASTDEPAEASTDETVLEPVAPE